ADVLAELRQLEALLADPELASHLGVEPPRGVLLTGPPGTGKTTVARVLAARARCSFYPVSAADVTSRWHGESERSVQRLFERARAHRPSIVFLDEVDAIARERGHDPSGAGDRQLTQLLTEIDGLASADGVLVLAATNRPDVLDPALLRGGRLSRPITLPLPDEGLRLELLRQLTARMPTVGLDLARVAAATGGLSHADRGSLCQQAALHALVRVRDAGGPTPRSRCCPRTSPARSWTPAAELDRRPGQGQLATLSRKRCRSTSTRRCRTFATISSSERTIT